MLFISLLKHRVTSLCKQNQIFPGNSFNAKIVMQLYISYNKLSLKKVLRYQ